MKLLVLSLLSFNLFAASLVGEYKLDMGDIDCPTYVSISKKDNAISIVKTYEASRVQESYTTSMVIKSSRKSKIKLDISQSEIKVKTFYKRSLQSEEMTNFKSYTLTSPTVRQDMVYQESDIENMDFMRCTYIRN